MSQTHKTDWTPDDAPTDDDFNRIEENVKENRGDIDDIELDIDNIDTRYSAGNCRVYLDGTTASGTATSYTKVKEADVGFGNECRVKFKLKCDDQTETAYAKIYINGSAVGTTRSRSSESYATYSEDIDVSPGDKVQIYAKVTNGDWGIHFAVEDFEISVDKGLVAG